MTILKVRGLALSEEARQRIVDCRDPALLENWFQALGRVHGRQGHRLVLGVVAWVAAGEVRRIDGDIGKEALDASSSMPRPPR